MGAIKWRSDDDLALVVVVAEGCGRAAFLLLEDTVEIADVVEAALVADFCHVGGGVHQKAGSMTETDVYDVVRHGLACTHTEEAAEGGWRHASNVGERLQAYLVLEVGVYVLLHVADTLALGGVLDIGKGLACQQVVVVLEGELVEYLQQAKHTIESWLCAGDVGELAVQLHDGWQLEGNASLGVLEEGTEAAQLVLGKELLAQQVVGELYGYLVYGVALAVVLIPGVLQPAAYEHEVVLAQYLYGVAYDTACAIAVLHEVEPHLVVLMQGVAEGFLVTVYHIEAVLLGQWGNLCYCLFHKYICFFPPLNYIFYATLANFIPPNAMCDGF